MSESAYANLQLWFLLTIPSYDRLLGSSVLGGIDSCQSISDLTNVVGACLAFVAKLQHFV